MMQPHPLPLARQTDMRIPSCQGFGFRALPLSRNPLSTNSRPYSCPLRHSHHPLLLPPRPKVVRRQIVDFQVSVPYCARIGHIRSAHVRSLLQRVQYAYAVRYRHTNYYKFIDTGSIPHMVHTLHEAFILPYPIRNWFFYVFFFFFFFFFL
ncbi:hypothetical protein F5Y03DRAFT_339312, partial [Xylaria venustula]